MAINFQEISLNQIEWNDEKVSYKDANLVFKCPDVKLLKTPVINRKKMTFYFIIDDLLKFIRFLVDIERIYKTKIDNIDNWFSNIKMINGYLTLKVKGIKRMLISNLDLKKIDLDKKYTITLEVSKLWSIEDKTGFSLFLREIYS